MDCIVGNFWQSCILGQHPIAVLFGISVGALIVAAIALLVYVVVGLIKDEVFK